MKSIQTYVLASIVAAFSASNCHAAPHNNEHYYLAEYERELEDLIQVSSPICINVHMPIPVAYLTILSLFLLSTIPSTTEGSVHEHEYELRQQLQL